MAVAYQCDCCGKFAPRGSYGPPDGWQEVLVAPSIIGSTFNGSGGVLHLVRLACSWRCAVRITVALFKEQA